MRSRPPLRCSQHSCGRFAKTPEGWDDDGRQIVAFPLCTPCAKREALRDKRRAVLAANVAKSERDLCRDCRVV